MLNRVGDDHGQWAFGIVSRVKPALLCLLVLALVGCGFGPSEEIRYRITIEVDTPEGVRSGSSVWAFRLRPGDIDDLNSISGEAVAVDLPRGGTLYVLRVGGGNDGVFQGVGQMLPENVYRRVGLTREIEREALGDRMRVLRYIRQLPRQRIALDCSSYPPSECLMLVRFRNPSDPASVEAVPHEQLEQVFGRGVRLRAIVLEITDDEPSFNLEERLSWLDGPPETRLRPAVNIRDHSLPALLSYSAFQRR